MCTEPELHNPDEIHLNTQEGACLDIAMNGFGVVILRDVLLMSAFLIHLPLLSVLPRFLLPLRSMRISSLELTVREFVRLSMLLFTLIIMSATGGRLKKPQFSTSIWLPSYWLSGVMNSPWFWVGFSVVLVSVCSGQPFSAFEVHTCSLVLTLGSTTNGFSVSGVLTV